MRARERVTCLAIGDGQNDVPMIKASDIGVGIRGVEGTSGWSWPFALKKSICKLHSVMPLSLCFLAVASADYSIAQFRFLSKLLLVHGRLNYRRIAILVCYVFYKSSFVVWCTFIFGIYSGFSGQQFALDWPLQLHSVAFTALPILVFSVLDYDLKPETLLQQPALFMLS
jgi:magnesium-transporting ATPase (P-type)